MTFAVITRVADPATGGNLASAIGELFVQVEAPSERAGWLGRYEPANPMVAMHIRSPVFNVGEIVILNESGREVCYPGRKPDKWDVDYEDFDDLGEAIKRANEVFEHAMEALRG